MKLLWSSRSPFARKVTIAAHELGIADMLTLERVVVNAVKPNAEVMRIHPLSKIPALVLDDGTVLIDSRVIVEYLADRVGNTTLLPQDKTRWPALRLQALADAIMETDLRWLDERFREEAYRLPAQIEACRIKIVSGLDALEADPPPAAGVNIGHIATASALAHLDFRFPDLGWRNGHPRLAAWHEAFSRRPSMVATAFSEVY
jgi:glutathione S-transferase